MVKIVVHSAEGCCTATTMALISINQKWLNTLYKLLLISSHQYGDVQFNQRYISMKLVFKFGKLFHLLDDTSLSIYGVFVKYFTNTLYGLQTQCLIFM